MRQCRPQTHATVGFACCRLVVGVSSPHTQCTVAEAKFWLIANGRTPGNGNCMAARTSAPLIPCRLNTPAAVWGSAWKAARTSATARLVPSKRHRPWRMLGSCRIDRVGIACLTIRRDYRQRAQTIAVAPGHDSPASSILEGRRRAIHPVIYAILRTGPRRFRKRQAQRMPVFPWSIPGPWRSGRVPFATGVRVCGGGWRDASRPCAG